jgi:hypothetical protein
MSKRIFTGLKPRHLGRIVAELAQPWLAAEESRLRDRRGHERERAAGAGPDHGLPFTDRVIVTLVCLRFQLPHGLLAALYGVHRSTVTRAVREIRPLLAARGFAVPEGQRLKTMADVFAYAGAHGITLRMDGTEVQVRRPKAGRPGRRAFVSGKKKMNTKKATVFTDDAGRSLFAGVFRPGRMHDQTAVRTEGIADLLTRFPQVRLKVDAGYRGLAREFPDQVEAPPLKPKKDAALGTDLRRARQRRPQEMAAPAALPRKPRRLRRDLPGDRRTGLRPRRRPVNPQPPRQATMTHR